jgi:hypothetical protein
VTTQPTDTSFFPAFAEYLGISGHLSSERVAYAMRQHADFHPKLVAMRAIPLRFLEPVIEPATALTWIERGGHL